MSQLQDLQDDVNRLRHDVAAARQEALNAATAAESSAKAVERLSILVMGDPELRVPSLVDDVADLKRERQAQLVSRAKLAGIYLGASTVCVVLGKALWMLVEHWLTLGNHTETV